MAEDKSQELNELLVTGTLGEHGNTGAEGSGEAGDVTRRQNNGYVMVEDKPDELQRSAVLQEFVNTAESPDGAADVSMRPSERSGGQAESDSDDDEELAFWLALERGSTKDQQPEDLEKKLLETVENKRYHKVHGRLTAKALMDYSHNPLLLAIKITEKLDGRVKEKKPDKYDFINMANRVEEFAMRFLDPLKYEDDQREDFFKNSETDLIVKTAIKLEQKKVFDHPVIIDLLNERWYGVYVKSSTLLWLFLNVWCLFDMVLFPLSFLVTFVIGYLSHRKNPRRPPGQFTEIHKQYKTYFKIPYFIFVRDMISYLALLALHLAICVQPSQLSFSGLEWTILVLLSGRLLTEIKQIIDLRRLENGEKTPFLEITKNYFRDRWNVFDFFILVIFICAIFPLRIITLAVSGSVINNRALVTAGYLYGFNTMLLTFRSFGSILETFKEVGTIQIALFHIIRDAAVVVVHFVAITLAFASSITKVFVSEKSMVKEDITEKPLGCNKTGIECWWKIATHLAWSLLDLSEGLAVLESTDFFSETLAHLLFAAYLILALILLVNMLIALLSNTYQRVQDNSRNEWVFRKAITIQTYRTYHPIPVPFNIITIFVLWIYYCLRKNKAEKRDETDRAQEPQLNPKYLLDRYRLKYGDFLPPTDKLDQVLDDADTTESMVNQVLYRNFTHQQGSNKALLPTGPEAWETHKAILVDDCLITRQPYVRRLIRCGARYKTAFSRRFPHFEVMILESGETRWLGLGVVFEDFGTHLMPGWQDGTVGYHTDDRKIFDSENSIQGKETIGANAARRGDVIRCTVKFEDKQERDGKIQVPVVFSVNGSRIVPKDKKDPCIEYSEDRPLFPYIAFQYENSVLAKMCAREDIDFDGQEMKSNLADIQSNLESKLEYVRADMQTKLQSLQEKLDAVLAKLGEK